MLGRQNKKHSKKSNYAEIRPTFPGGRRLRGELEKSARQRSLNVTCRYYSGNNGDRLACNNDSGKVGDNFTITPSARFYQFA
jgi:hypothetical protein